MIIIAMIKLDLLLETLEYEYQVGILEISFLNENYLY